MYIYLARFAYRLLAAVAAAWRAHRRTQTVAVGRQLVGCLAHTTAVSRTHHQAETLALGHQLVHAGEPLLALDARYLRMWPGRSVVALAGLHRQDTPVVSVGRCGAEA